MNARDYQVQSAQRLRRIFGPQVWTEWDSVKYDFHTGNHKDVYAPRHDIAVGPCNSYGDLDIGRDNTKSLQQHPFTKELYKSRFEAGLKMKDVWNSFSRCYLAIEIEFETPSKHILGGMINASASGSLGIVIVRDGQMNLAQRLFNYLLRLESFDTVKIPHLGNLSFFSDGEFRELLNKF